MRTKNKRNTYLPVLLFAIVLALTFGAMLLAGQLRQRKIARPGKYNSPDQIPRVTVAEAHQALTTGEAVLIDTRDIVSFNALHIKGALNFPVNEIESRLTELDPNTWYITYCT
jgi:hypothetical protein